MKFYKFAPNLHISDDPRFSEYSQEIVWGLLKDVDVNFSHCLSMQQFSSQDCYITYRENNPMCCKTPCGHLILLHVSANYWCKWVYQFAHEYCHHLINGQLAGGDISGLMWFEESICELSSMFHLHVIHSQWSNPQENLTKTRYAPAFREYLDDILRENPLLLSESEHPGWLRSWKTLLYEPKYHREHYNVIAVKMLPLFLKNPNLWKIILHFGDMRQWKSLDELFAHLYSEVDDSYSDSLRDLHNILFS